MQQVYFALFALVCAYMVFVMADVDGPIPYQSSCDPTASDKNCSSSEYCQCATTSTGQPICTQQMNCDYAAQCGVNNTCEKPNSTCVMDSRCPGKSLCYAIVIFSPELCPPPPSDGSMK